MFKATRVCALGRRARSFLFITQLCFSQAWDPDLSFLCEDVNSQALIPLFGFQVHQRHSPESDFFFFFFSLPFLSWFSLLGSESHLLLAAAGLGLVSGSCCPPTPTPGGSPPNPGRPTPPAAAFPRGSFSPPASAPAALRLTWSHLTFALTGLTHVCSSRSWVGKSGVRIPWLRRGRAAPVATHPCLFLSLSFAGPLLHELSVSSSTSSSPGRCWPP